MAGVFNIATGFEGYYASLPAATDSLIVVLLKAGGDADEVLITYDTLSAVLAANNEANFTNYTRLALSNVTSDASDSENARLIDADDFTYTSAGGATNNTIARLLICYKPATGSADTAIVPVSFHTCEFTTDGTNQPILIPSGGFVRCG